MTIRFVYKGKERCLDLAELLHFETRLSSKKKELLILHVLPLHTDQVVVRKYRVEEIAEYGKLLYKLYNHTGIAEAVVKRLQSFINWLEISRIKLKETGLCERNKVIADYVGHLGLDQDELYDIIYWVEKLGLLKEVKK